MAGSTRQRQLASAARSTRTGTTRTRRSREELRSLVLAAGQELLLEEGLGTGGERITFKRVFDRLEAEHGIKVTNASVIGRIWEDQAEFQTEVLSLVARSDLSWELEHTLAPLEAVFQELDPTSPESRRRTIQQLCRVGGGANQDAMATSPTWGAWLAIWAYSVQHTRRGEPPKPGAATPPPEIRRALLASYEGDTEAYENLYRSVCEMVGFRCRAPFTFRQFTTAVSAMSEGSSLRDRIDPDSTRGILRPTGPCGELEEWSLLGIGIEALAEEFFEPDPDWTPPTS